MQTSRANKVRDIIVGTAVDCIRKFFRFVPNHWIVPMSPSNRLVVSRASREDIVEVWTIQVVPQSVSLGEGPFAPAESSSRV